MWTDCCGFEKERISTYFLAVPNPLKVLTIQNSVSSNLIVILWNYFTIKLRDKNMQKGWLINNSESTIRIFYDIHIIKKSYGSFIINWTGFVNSISLFKLNQFSIIQHYQPVQSPPIHHQSQNSNPAGGCTLTPHGGSSPTASLDDDAGNNSGGGNALGHTARTPPETVRIHGFFFSFTTISWAYRSYQAGWLYVDDR